MTAAGDLDLTSGNLRLETDPAEALAIKLRARYRLFQGEYFLDTRIGVPYFQFILVHNPNLPVVKSILSKVITQTPGVKSLDTFDLTYDRGARTAAFTFRATTDTGAVISGGSGTPFIVESI
jgi:hypothetical protein